MLPALDNQALSSLHTDDLLPMSCSLLLLFSIPIPPNAKYNVASAYRCRDEVMVSR